MNKASLFSLVIFTIFLGAVFIILADTDKETAPEPVVEKPAIERFKEADKESLRKLIKYEADPEKGLAWPKMSNKIFFNSVIFPALRKEECGECKKLCHYDPKDLGGVTCAGISHKAHPEELVKLLNLTENCKTHFTGQQLCDMKPRWSYIKDFYFKEYASYFSKCDPAAFKFLMDSAVLEGSGTAIRRFQKVSGLAIDGIMGANSIKACQDRIPAEKFTELRLARAKRLKTYSAHGLGWDRRSRRVLKRYLDERRVYEKISSVQ